MKFRFTHGPARRVVLVSVAVGVVVHVAAPPIGAAPDDRADQMRELAVTGAAMVTDYFQQIGVSARPRMTFIPSGVSGSSRCVDVDGQHTQHDRSFYYCATDDAVHLGQDILWDSYRQFGAAAAISGIAHEFGHSLQALVGVPNPRKPAETIGSENQADCVSGAFMGHLRDSGNTDLTSAEDLDGITGYLTATASVEGPGRDHGTAAERIESFTLGYDGGLPACNRFYPNTPLAPAPR